MQASGTDATVPTPPGTEPGDEALLHALATEETREAGWEQLVHRYQSPLHVFASSLTRDGEAADEVVQACWVELWKAVVLKRQTVRQLKGWLYKLASRKALTLMRERRKRAAMPAETPETETCSSTHETESREIRTILYQLVDGLPDRLRLPVLLHYGPEYNQTEIANLLDCRQSTVSERLSEAFARLKHELHQRGLVTLPVALPVLLQETFASPPAGVAVSMPFPVASEIARQARVLSGKSGTGAGLKVLAWSGGALVLLALPAYLILSSTPASNSVKTSPPIAPQQQTAEQPWQSLAGKHVHVPQKAYGTWAWQPGKTEQELVYTPAEPRGRTFCYLDDTRQTPVEWRGRLESLDSRGAHFALGLAHPNRVNFSGITWQLEQKHFPIDFHVQIWCDETGSRLAIKMRGADGSSFVSGEFSGQDAALQAAVDPAQQPAWQEYPKLLSYGLACASSGAMRITRLETRALETSERWK